MSYQSEIPPPGSKDSVSFEELTHAGLVRIFRWQDAPVFFFIKPYPKPVKSMPRQQVIFISYPLSYHPILDTHKCPVSSVYPTVSWVDEQTNIYSKSKDNITRIIRKPPKHGGTTLLRNIRNVTFALKRENCPTVTVTGNQIPQVRNCQNLGIYLDRRLTWRTHIFAKRK
jgi:hypothetical protein